MAAEHKILRGEGAGQWLPFARTKVAALHRRAGGGALTQRFVVEGGDVSIKVSVIGDQRYIDIRRKTCPPFFSGLCDLVLHKEGDVVGPDVPLTPIYQVGDPAIDVFRRVYPSPATPVADRAWRDEPRLARDQDAAKQMIGLKATMFSGEMRKVVQVLQGMNVPVPYSPAWGPTHGVFKATGGERWIIEIANEGIQAWAMGMCRNPIRNASGATALDYTPIATPKPTGEALDAALAAGSVLVLAGPDEVRDAYSRIPFFTTCGWAFNHDGHEAASAVWHMDGDYIRSALFVVTIAEVDGKPASAAVTKAEEGFIHGPRSLCFMKFPLGSRHQLYSFDPSPGDPPYLHSSEAPVFTFYDGERRVVVRYVHDLAAGHTDVYSDSMTYPDDCTAPAVFGTYRRSGTETHQPQPHIAGDDIPAARTYLQASSLNTLDVGIPNPLGCAFLDENNSVYGYVYDVQQVTFVKRTTATDSEVTLSAFVVPLWEREGYYYAHLVRRNTKDASRQQVSTPCFEALHQATMAAPGSLFSGRCNTVDGTTEVTGLTGVTTNSPCAPGQWRVRVLPAQLGVKKYAPGLSAGAAFVAEQRDGAACVLQGTPTPSEETTNLPGSDYYTEAPAFFFRGSGGVRYTLPTPAGDAYVSKESRLETALFRFIGNETQLLTVLRDAFDPHKFAISPGMNLTLGPDLKSELADYPVAEAGANYTLVGVP